MNVYQTTPTVANTLQYSPTKLEHKVNGRSVISEYEISHLKVVGHENGGGSGNKLLLEYGFGPWRSMSV
jgi:hypothetical protein